MDTNVEEKIKKIKKQIIIVNIYDTPGLIMIALGAFAKFSKSSDPFHPLLKNDDVANFMLVAGTATVFICGRRMFRLIREIIHIKNKYSM